MDGLIREGSAGVGAGTQSHFLFLQAVGRYRGWRRVRGDGNCPGHGGVGQSSCLLYWFLCHIRVSVRRALILFNAALRGFYRAVGYSLIEQIVARLRSDRQLLVFPKRPAPTFQDTL